MKAPPVSLEDPWPSQRNKPKNLHFSTPSAPEPWIVKINITKGVPLKSLTSAIGSMLWRGGIYPSPPSLHLLLLFLMPQLPLQYSAPLLLPLSSLLLPRCLLFLCPCSTRVYIQFIHNQIPASSVQQIQFQLLDLAMAASSGFSLSTNGSRQNITTAQTKQLAVLGSSGCDVRDRTSPTLSPDCSAPALPDNNATIPWSSSIPTGGLEAASGQPEDPWILLGAKPKAPASSSPRSESAEGRSVVGQGKHSSKWSYHSQQPQEIQLENKFILDLQDFSTLACQSPATRQMPTAHALEAGNELLSAASAPDARLLSGHLSGEGCCVSQW
eukprot:superscaffoldBa00001373_g10270